MSAGGEAPRRCLERMALEQRLVVERVRGQRLYPAHRLLDGARDDPARRLVLVGLGELEARQLHADVADDGRQGPRDVLAHDGADELAEQAAEQETTRLRPTSLMPSFTATRIAGRKSRGVTPESLPGPGESAYEPFDREGGAVRALLVNRCARAYARVRGAAVGAAAAGRRTPSTRGNSHTIA